MAYQTNTSLSTKYSRFSQQGAGLILMVFILTLVVLAYTVKSLNGNDFRAKEATNTSQALAEAKAALMSWSINHPNTPGLMPYPDRNADAGGYDGLSDCPGGTTLYSHLIGRLPWKNADYDNCNVLLNGLGKEFFIAYRSISFIGLFFFCSCLHSSHFPHSRAKGFFSPLIQSANLEHPQ